MAFIVIVIAAIILVALYLKRSTTISEEIRQTITSGTGQTVQTIQELPEAIRNKMKEMNEERNDRREKALDGIIGE